MGLTDRERQANRRARLKGEPEPYGADYVAQQKQAKEVRDIEEKDISQALIEDALFDASGGRFKSEARTRTQLRRIYYGQPENGDVDGDAEEGETKKSKKSKERRVKPSETTIQIQNTTIDPFDKKRGRRKSSDDVDYEVNDKVSFERWLELRDRARKDLFWLGRVVGNGFYRSVHQVICDQFVQKNFGGFWLKSDGSIDESKPEVKPMYFDGYTLDDFHAMIESHQLFDESGKKNPYGRYIEMMLLDSRGFYKSTINGVDSLQWLLNCPDIRILIITGEYKLAVKFLGSVKKYFHLSEGEKPKALHLLFPEYVLYGKEGTSDSPLECPARILKQDEASLWVNSIVANLSGWHCDIKKGDDIVTDENSNSEESREKLKEKYDGSDDLLDPHGFMDHIGTRYFTDDWYGMRLSVDKDTGLQVPIQYFKRGCWTVKPEYLEVPLNQLTAEMVDLNFPQRWGFQKLRGLLLKKMAGTGSDRAFRNQQLNEPTDPNEDSDFKISFTDQTLRSHMYQREAAPKLGDVYVVWDWALSNKKTSDYSAGVVARRYKNDSNEFAFVILEVVFGKWNYSEVAFQVVALSKKWGPQVTIIEASNGYELLRDEISRVAQRQCYDFHPYFKAPSREDNAKRNRIKSVEILLNDHRIHFVMGPWIDETFKQFTQYTGEKKNKGRKDDIPDAVSYLINFLPFSERHLAVQIDSNEERRLLEEQDKQFRKARHYEAYFGDRFNSQKQGGNSQAPKMSQWRQGYQADVAPQPVAEPVVEAPKPQDPRMRIFGNNKAFRL